MSKEKKMAVKYLRHDGRYFEEDVRHCKESLARHLIKSGVAVAYNPPPPPETSEPAAPEDSSEASGSEDSGAEEENLSSLSKEELVERGKAAGFRGAHLMKTSTLIDKLSEKE